MQPDLTQLLHLIENMPVYNQLVEGVKRQNDGMRVVMLDAAKPYFMAALYRSLRIPMLVVTSQPENCKELYEQLSTWSDSQVKLFPEPDALPYERISSDASTALERVQVLSSLVSYDCSDPSTDAPLIVTSTPALIGKTTLHADFATTCHTIKLGMEVEPFGLLRQWEAMGYRMESMVEVQGTVSHRGSILDIYPPTDELPARIEFYGNTVESIRLFDPANQRSLKTVPYIDIGPATELLAPLIKDKLELEKVLSNIDLSGCTPEVSGQFKQRIAMLLDRQRPPDVQFLAPIFNRDSILNYLPRNALLILDEPMNIEQAVEELDTGAEQMRSDKLERGELPRNFPRPYFTWDELEPYIKGKQHLMLNGWGIDGHRLSFISAPGYAGQLSSFIGSSSIR
ncbi:transcription-repair coupling factor, partial [Chloroflexota bacterium]